MDDDVDYDVEEEDGERIKAESKVAGSTVNSMCDKPHYERKRRAAEASDRVAEELLLATLENNAPMDAMLATIDKIQISLYSRIKDPVDREELMKVWRNECCVDISAAQGRLKEHVLKYFDLIWLYRRAKRVSWIKRIEADADEEYTDSRMIRYRNLNIKRLMRDPPRHSSV